jgi:hypothetical protein
MDGTLTKAVIDFADMRRRVAAVEGLDSLNGVWAVALEPETAWEAAWGRLGGCEVPAAAALA